MNNDGNGLVYMDQASAERVLDNFRAETRDLLDALTDLNDVLDSIKLQSLIQKYHDILFPF